MGLGDVAGLHASLDRVAVHEQGHGCLLSDDTIDVSRLTLHRSNYRCRVHAMTDTGDARILAEAP